MLLLFVLAALCFCGLSVYTLCKANYCACKHAGECDNPVSRYWLIAITSAMVSLLLCCLAFHSETGTLIWLLMMASTLAGALLSERWQHLKQRCKNSLFTTSASK